MSGKLIILGGNTDERYVLGGSIMETDILMHPTWCYKKLAAESNSANVLRKRLDTLISKMQDGIRIKYNTRGKVAMKVPDNTHLIYNVYNLQSILDVANAIRKHKGLSNVNIGLPEGPHNTCDGNYDAIFIDDESNKKVIERKNNEKIELANTIESFYIDILESINDIE
jgi:hypothetical protein